jgi:hypothetical protein
MRNLWRVIDQFPRYDMKILLGNFSAKVCTEDIFKLAIRYDSSHEISKDSGVTAGNVAASKNVVIKSTMFPHGRTDKYSWKCPEGDAQPV